MPRNLLVESAVDAALRSIDASIEGEKLTALPVPAARTAMDRQLGHSSKPSAWTQFQ
jgi:hypothetical protein